MILPSRDPFQPGDLPRPDDTALGHSGRVAELIRAEINAAGGSISFRRYMELALYAPGLGYYSAGAAKFGAQGDFVTAPEISPLFSMCLARQCEQILDLAGGSIILEIGAGSGRMACDILRELDQRGRLPQEYWILETSADLRLRQSQLINRELPESAPRVRWLDRLPESPVRGVILANEVLDAAPVHRVGIRNTSIDEIRVAWSNTGFSWRRQPAEGELAAEVRHIVQQLENPLPDVYVTEINLDLAAWIAAWAGILEAGAILLIDYGYPRREYFHPQRRDGTLLCHYRHRVHGDPFLYPGLQDISASVDFTAVAEAGARAGIELYGFTTQAHFLMACGLDEIAARESKGAPRATLEISRQIKLLTLPGEMGEHVKAMALGRGLRQRRLAGFRIVDHRQRL